MADVRGGRAVLAVPRVVEQEHPAAVRDGGRVRQQQLQSAVVDPLVVPPGLGQEEVQALHRRMLRPDHRLRPGQSRQRLVPIPRREQPDQVLAKTPPLRERDTSSNRAAYPSNGPGAAGAD
jgi:hypothetical protein